jgi:hypothetical protein
MTEQFLGEMRDDLQRQRRLLAAPNADQHSLNPSDSAEPVGLSRGS